jgi:glycosyltransferase involved in cell wall biosynthesis
LNNGGDVPRPSLWIINHYAQLPDQPGGTRHIELSTRLVCSGFDVTLIGSGFHHVTRSMAGMSSGTATHQGVKVVSIPSRIRYRGNGIARMAGMVEFAARVLRWGNRCRHCRDDVPDMIVASSPHLLTAWAGLRLARRYRIPFVLEIRDLWPDSLVTFGMVSERHPVVWTLRRLERRLYLQADLIVSLLPHAYRHIRDVCGSDRDVLWLPNGANDAPDRPVGADPAKDGEMTVMYVGAMGRANVLSDLLAAAKIVAEECGALVRFVLVGEGPEKALLEKRTSDLGLTNVEFRAGVPKTEVPRLLARADICIALLEDAALYRYGVALNKLFDYMAAGRPILFAGHISHDYVQLARCGITVAPRDPHAIAAAVKTFLGMTQAERSVLGERGRQYATVHHSWDVLADRLADALKLLLSGNDATRTGS